MKRLSVTEMAERLGIDPSLVRVYCREGRIKAEKMGRDWFASEGAVQRFERNRAGRGRPAKSPERSK
jgi:excisionase family DNA binding protein